MHQWKFPLMLIQFHFYSEKLFERQKKNPIPLWCDFNSNSWDHTLHEVDVINKHRGIRYSKNGAIENDREIKFQTTHGREKSSES